MGEVRETAAAFVNAADRTTAKLFMHGGSQAVRLPKAFRFDGVEVSVRRDGDAVILEPLAVDRAPTVEELNAFFAEVDALRGDLEIAVAPENLSTWRAPDAW